jgi:hypothetical protein
MSQPGRARLAGVSRWVSRQISFWCSVRADGSFAKAGGAARKAAPFTKIVRRETVISVPAAQIRLKI